MGIPAIHLVKTNHVDDNSPVMLDVVENYLHIKCNDDCICVRTAQRKGNYVAKLLGCHYRQLNRLTKRVVAPSYFQDIVMTMSAISTQPVLLKTNGYSRWQSQIMSSSHSVTQCVIGYEQ